MNGRVPHDLSPWRAPLAWNGGYDPRGRQALNEWQVRAQIAELAALVRDVLPDAAERDRLVKLA